MPKLRLELFRYGSLVFGKVLEQAEELRAAEDETVLAAENGFSLKIHLNPEISGSSLFLRGTQKMKDNDIFFAEFETDLEAATFCKAVQVMVDRINGEPESNSSVVKVM